MYDIVPKEHGGDGKITFIVYQEIDQIVQAVCHCYQVKA
jgi:hypothetical protein